MKFPGFIGPAYTLRSVNVDCQRCINLFPEFNELGTGKENEVAALYPTPGLQKIAEVGAGPIRLVHFDGTVQDPENPGTRVFVVSGNEIYSLTYDSVDEEWDSSLLGTIDTNTGPVSAASNAVELGQTVFVDGLNSYLFKREFGPTEQFGPFSDFDLEPVPNATQVVFVDGYFVYVNGTNQFFVSDFNSLVVDPLSFAAAEGDPDNIVGVITNQRDLWFFNAESTEIFVNTGNADFPFERIQSGFIENGCAADFSIAKIDNYVFWLGRDKTGQGSVFAGRGLDPQRISTHAIEHAISTYADISTAVAYTYKSGGHSFYVLNFAEATWVYDLSTKLWHERAFLNEGLFERHRAGFHSFIPEFSFHMLGDYANNKIYKFNDQYRFDDESPIKRLRSAPHVSAGLKEVFCSYFQVDLQPGVGLDGIGQGTNPKMMMRFSNDGGHSWSNEKWVSMGKIGQTLARAIWRRLGVFRDRVFEVSVTDPVNVVLIGAQIELEVGAG